MKKTTILLAAMLLAMLLVFAATENADAQYGHWGSGIPTYPYGGGFFASPYSLGQVPTPPYFALHPPVYYSHPVARSYGYSPYAYPGTTMTPEVYESSGPAPEVIMNPYVEPTSSQQHTNEDEDLKTAQVKPTVIINPYATASANRFIVSVADVD